MLTFHSRTNPPPAEPRACERLPAVCTAVDKRTLMQRKKCRSGGTTGTPRSAGCCDCFRRPRCTAVHGRRQCEDRQDKTRYGEAGRQDRAGPEKHKETQQQTWVGEGGPISRLGERQGQTTDRQKFRNRKAANACVLGCDQVAQQQWLVLTGLCLVCSSGRVRRVCDKLDEGNEKHEMETHGELGDPGSWLSAGVFLVCRRFSFG